MCKRSNIKKEEGGNPFATKHDCNCACIIMKMPIFHPGIKGSLIQESILMGLAKLKYI